jgi:hypothetical protein
MKAFNEMMERREAERKTYEEKMMAEWEADKKKKKNANFEKGWPSGKPTEKNGRLNGKPTEKKWQQSWKPFMTRQTPTR